MKIINRLLILVVAFVAILFGYQPVLNFGFAGLPLIILALTALWSILRFKDQIKDALEGKVVKPIAIDKISIGIFIAVLLYLFVYGTFATHPLFNNQEYRNLIGTVKIGEKLENHISPISLEKIRVVDEQLANLVGDKVLGSQPALGSQVQLGRFTIQKVKEDLYWVAPLLHSGLFKWLNNLSGSNGYVMVSATNERDVKLVQNINGKEVRIKYQPESFLMQNLARHLYFSGYMTKGLTDYTFEIDDNGEAYWVVTLFAKKVGFSGDEAIGVATVNAASGEIKQYSIADSPKWIDRIQPNDFVEKQLNYWGEYVKGYWNFSNEEKLQITEGVTLVYGEDNRSYWYTGLTSVGADEATVGFVLVDTHTKETIWYKQGGATEYAARTSAIGKVQEKGYYASDAIPYNINGKPTYVMTLKDKGGLVKMYAMVAVHDYTIVGVGNNLREALSSFKGASNQTGSSLGVESSATRKTVKGVIVRFSNDIKNGNSYYYLQLKEGKAIYIGSSQISSLLPITAIGDSVEISFDGDSNEVIDLSSFKNTSLSN